MKQSQWKTNNVLTYRSLQFTSKEKEKKRKRAQNRVISMIVGKAKKFRACRMPKYCPNSKWNAKHETNIHRSLIAQNHALNGSIAMNRSAPHSAPKTDIYSIYLNERNETKFINKFNHFPIIFRPFDGFYCSFSLICVLFNFSCSFAFGSTFRGIQFSFFRLFILQVKWKEMNSKERYWICVGKRIFCIFYSRCNHSNKYDK